MSCSSLSCVIRIIRAENVELGKKAAKGGCLFVRMYLPVDNDNGRVQVNTKDLPLSTTSKGGNFKWDQSFSLQCDGKDQDVVSQLKRGSVALELRWRPKPTMWGQASSRLLGSAELPWGPAFSSPIQAWVPLITNTTTTTSTSKMQTSFGTTPGLLVAMTVEATTESRRRPRRRSVEEGRCGCGGDHDTCNDDYQLFALAAAFEAF